MTFEEFESASAAELREHARGAFNKGNTSDASWAGNTNLLLEAQFYISEIDRRHDAKIATRDFRMELIVIALILFEFIAALIGIIITIREGKAQAILEDQLMSKQTAVIQKLSDSADITAASQKATAGTLQSLQGTMERMNRAVQGQLALFYDVSLNVFWDAEIKQLRLSNNGRTNISLVGVKFADKQPRFIAEQVITPNAVYTERVSDIDDATASLPKETSRSFPILLYLKNAKQEEFVVEQNIDLYWEGDKVSVRTQTSSIRPERWSRSRKEQK